MELDFDVQSLDKEKISSGDDMLFNANVRLLRLTNE